MLGAVVTILLYSCGSSAAPGAGHGCYASSSAAGDSSSFASPATTYKEYSATLEGRVNVEIRPQVEGYLEKIYVDEGAYVKAGQPLFKINDRIYNEQLNSASIKCAGCSGQCGKSAGRG